MRLLLDEHYSPKIAEQLRARGYDVFAVGETVELRQLEDEDLLLWARKDGRVVVTENVSDFMHWHRTFLVRGEAHAGILFTSPKAFPRRTGAIGRMITALATFIDDRAGTDVLESEIAWL